MQQSWGSQMLVSFLSHLDKFLFSYAISQVLVLLAVLANGDKWHRLSQTIGWIVMPGPDLDIIRQRQDLTG